MSLLFTITAIIVSIVVIIAIYQYYNHYYKFKRQLFFDEKYVNTNTKYLIENAENEENGENLYLHQTYFDKSKIPQDVYDNIKKYAPEYKHMIYDDNDIIEFLGKYFNQSLIDAFNNLKKGAHKADLARYCILYIYGGLYLDIKTELIMPVSEIFKDKSTFYSVISFKNDHIYQGIISSSPKNPLFLSLIDYIVKTGNPYDYLDFCKDLHFQISQDTRSPVLPGFKKGDYQSYYLFQEKCSESDDSMCYDGFDRYGKCCFVWDGDKPIIKSRRSSFPWN